MTNQNSPTVKVLLLVQDVSRVISVTNAKKQKSIVEDVQNNGFVTNVMNEKINANMLPRNIVYVVKKSHYKNLI